MIYQKLHLCLTMFWLCGRLPFWSYAKLIATCWLVIPYFSGAAYVYDHFVRPFFVNPRSVNIWYVPRKKDIFSKQDDILTAAEKYIQEHGSDAFENIINGVSQQLYLFLKKNFFPDIIPLRTTSFHESRGLMKILFYGL